MQVQDFKEGILKVLHEDGHWVPSSFVAEALGLADLLKVEKALRNLAKQGFVKSNINRVLNVKFYHSLEETKIQHKKCPLCGSILKQMKCPNLACKVDSIRITYKGEGE